MTTNVQVVDGERAVRWTAEKAFHTLPCVAVGARVMLTSNKDLKRGAVNGATGHVTKLEYGPYPRSCAYPGGPTVAMRAVHVKLSHTGDVHRIGRDKSSYFYETKRFVKSTFPLALAYAITGDHPHA